MEHVPPPHEPRCPNCTASIPAGASHCPHCGARLAAPRDEPLSTFHIGCLSIFALAFGGIGTCGLAPVVVSLLDPTGFAGSSMGFFVPGVIASYFSILCVRRILESMRARRERDKM